MSEEDTRWRRPAPAALLAAAAVLLIAVNLRPGASSVGPVMAEIRADLGMTGTTAGILGALPGLAFAVFGALAVTLAIRVGINGAIMLGALAAAIGLLGRAAVGDVGPFLALTLLAFAGMAVGNVLVPAFVKRHFPGRPALMTGLYSAGLAVGATVPAAVTAPLAATLPGGWRAATGVWGLTAAVAVLPWASYALAERRRRVPGQRSVAWSIWSVARSRKAVAMAVFFAAQSTQAYVQFAWIAQAYRDGGLDQTTAGLMASIIAVFGIPAGIAMPALVSRVPDVRPLILALGLLLAMGYTGILLAPTTLPWLWAVFLGLSGAAFPLAIALFTLRTRDPRITSRVSGFTQSHGYLLAGLGPIAVGSLLEATGSWTAPLIVLACSSVVLTGAGLIAAAPGDVDDELPHLR